MIINEENSSSPMASSMAQANTDTNEHPNKIIDASSGSNSDYDDYDDNEEATEVATASSTGDTNTNKIEKANISQEAPLNEHENENVASSASMVTQPLDSPNLTSKQLNGVLDQGSKVNSNSSNVSNYVYVNRKELKKLQMSISQIQEQQIMQQKLIEQIQSQLETCVKAAQLKSNNSNNNSGVGVSVRANKLNEISNTKSTVVSNGHTNTTFNKSTNGKSKTRFFWILFLVLKLPIKSARLDQLQLLFFWNFFV